MAYVKDKNSITSRGKAMRFNKDKLRYELIHPKSYEDLGMTLNCIFNDCVVINKGYKPITIQLIKHHMELFKRGKDYDDVSGQLNISCVAAYLHVLNALEYTDTITFKSYDYTIPSAIEDLVKILTYGANKYTLYDDDGNITYDGSYNWRNGLSWTSVVASFERHMKAYIDGETNDNESGLPHLAHASTNIHFLNAFYYIFPQGDDRIKPIMNLPKIGLDIDEVLADFINPWCDLYPDAMRNPNTWYMDSQMAHRFNLMKELNELDDFYLNLPPKISPDDILFDPICYITARPVGTEITQRWIEVNRFPRVPIHTVSTGTSKIQTIIDSGCEVFIDDNFETFRELNNNNILCFLYDAPWNRKFDVGHLRIKTLRDLPYFR